MFVTFSLIKENELGEILIIKNKPSDSINVEKQTKKNKCFYWNY